MWFSSAYHDWYHIFLLLDIFLSWSQVSTSMSFFFGKIWVDIIFFGYVQSIWMLIFVVFVVFMTWTYRTIIVLAGEFPCGLLQMVISKCMEITSILFLWLKTISGSHHLYCMKAVRSTVTWDNKNAFVFMSLIPRKRQLILSWSH